MKMINAKEANAKTMALIKKDAEALNAKCVDFIETTVSEKIHEAIAERQLCCAVDVPGGLKQASGTIQQKLIDLGYSCRVSHGYTNYLAISWRE